MTKIDLERFIGDVIFNSLSSEWDISSLFEMALKNQGLKFKSDLDGWKIVPIEPLPEYSVREQVAEAKESFLNNKSEKLSLSEVAKICDKVWDDAMLSQAIEEVKYALNDKGLFYTGNENVLVWLKSLKQRLKGE